MRMILNVVFVVVLVTALQNPHEGLACQDLGQHGLRATEGKEQIIGLESHELPLSARVMDSISSTDGFYFLIKVGRENRIWKIDKEGKKSWEKPIGSDGLLQTSSLLSTKTGDGVGVCTPNPKSGATQLVFLDGSGKVDSKIDIGLQLPTAALRLADGGMLLFGQRDQETAGWAAKVDSKGTIQWTKHYPVKEPTAEPGRMLITISSLCRAVELPDASTVLVGQTGTYGKFGLGRSRLWLLKISPDGEKLTEKFLDDGYFNRYSHLRIESDPRVLSVHFWQHKLKESPGPEGLWPVMSIMDHNLKLFENYNLTESIPDETVVLGSLAPTMFPLPQPEFRKPLLVRLAGKEKDDTKRIRIEKTDGGKASEFIPLRSFENRGQVICFAIDGWMGSDQHSATLLVLRLSQLK